MQTRPGEVKQPNEGGFFSKILTVITRPFVKIGGLFSKIAKAVKACFSRNEPVSQLDDNSHQEINRQKSMHEKETAYKEGHANWFKKLHAVFPTEVKNSKEIGAKNRVYGKKEWSEFLNKAREESDKFEENKKNEYTSSSRSKIG